MKGVEQHSDNDCGLACVATICRKYGLKVPLVKLREQVKIGRNGISLYELSELMKRYNFEVDVMQGEFIELNDEIVKGNVTFPFIAHTITTGYLEHYVVVQKIVKSKVYIFDPAIGEEVYDENKFKQLWTGYIICGKPNEEFKKANYYKGVYENFISVIWEYKRIFLAIFFLQ